MPNLVIFIPAVVRNRRHVEMVRLQTLLRNRLRLYNRNASLRIFSCIVYDFITPEFFEDVLEFDFTIKLFSSEMNRHAPQCSGIRRPVGEFLDRVHRIFGNWDDLFLLRVIQDAAILDANALITELDRLIRSDRRNFLAGAFASCDNIHDFLQDLGVPRRPQYDYVQGAVMFARWATWFTHYQRLPDAITHHCDDSIMSQLVTAAGGELIEIPTVWVHRHDCPESASRATFEEHAAELTRSITRAPHPANLTRLSPLELRQDRAG